MNEEAVITLPREEGRPGRPQSRVGKLQSDRVARARREGAEYRFQPQGTQFQCVSSSDRAYRVSRTHCTCPDFQFRCAPAGISCKHQVALCEILIHPEDEGAKNMVRDF